MYLLSFANWNGTSAFLALITPSEVIVVWRVECGSVRLSAGLCAYLWRVLRQGGVASHGMSLLWRDVVIISTKLLDGKTVAFY